MHGLGPSDTNDAPEFPEVWAEAIDRVKQYFPFIEDGEVPFVAHNKAFDENCLKAVFAAYAEVSPMKRGNPSGKGEMPSYADAAPPVSSGGRSGAELNIERCKRMIELGRMTEAGLMAAISSFFGCQAQNFRSVEVAEFEKIITGSCKRAGQQEQ